MESFVYTYLIPAVTLLIGIFMGLALNMDSERILKKELYAKCLNNEIIIIDNNFYQCSFEKIK